MTHKKIKSQLVKLIVTIVALAIVVGASRFLYGTLEYAFYCYTIESIEREGDTGFWTENGKVYWPDRIVEKYNRAVQEKMQLVERSDVASFLYHSAYSTTGKFWRFISIVGNIAFLAVAVCWVYNYIRYLIRCLIRFLKRQKRRLCRHKHNR